MKVRWSKRNLIIPTSFKMSNQTRESECERL